MIHTIKTQTRKSGFFKRCSVIPSKALFLCDFCGELKRKIRNRLIINHKERREHKEGKTILTRWCSVIPSKALFLCDLCALCGELTAAFSAKHKARPVSTARAGYTLVEIAFASFVVGVAFLALVGLGRLAVQNAVDAENDTRSALLAEDIFATLRSTNDTISATGGPTAYATFWINFTNGTEIVLFQTAGEEPETSAHYINAEPNVTDTTPWIYGNGTTTRLKFVNPIAGSDVPQWTAQFSLTVDVMNAIYELYEGQLPEPITGPATNVTLATISLHIWPSAYGRHERSRSFYTHIPYKGLYRGQVVE